MWWSGQGGCWPLPHLAVPLLVGHRGGSGRCCCRLSGVALPQGLHGAAAVAGVRSAGRLRLPVSTSRVHCPSVRTVAVRRPRGLARNPSRCPLPRTARRCPGWTAAVRPAPGRTPAASRARPQLLSRAGTRWSPGADRPCTPADCGSGHRPPPADTARVSEVLAELRPPSDAVRTAGWRPRSGCPFGGGTGRGKRPLSSAASETAAGVRTGGVHRGHCRQPGYRKRSPARRPLRGCRHRR